MDGYHVIDPQESVNDADPSTGKVVKGMRVSAQDHVTGTVVHAFVPDHFYSVDNARKALEEKIGRVREVSALGSPPPAQG